MSTRLRLPGELFWPVLMCALGGVVWSLSAVAATSPTLRVVYGTLAATYFAVTISLLRLHNWARIAGAFLFGFGTFAAVYSIFKQGLGLDLTFRLALNAYWMGYLLLPSTKRFFNRDIRPGLSSWLRPMFDLAIFATALLGLLALGLSKWFVIAAVAVLMIIDGLLQSPIERFLGARFLRRPDDLDPGEWKLFREAQALRRRGDLLGAQQVQLPDVPTVRAFRGLLSLDLRESLDTLQRVLLDSAFVPGAESHFVLTQRIHHLGPDLDRLIESRAQIVDALLEDEARAHPVFAGEHIKALNTITGYLFVFNEAFRMREAWSADRPRCTGSRGRTWLTVRLWERLAAASAEVAARGAVDRNLADLAALTRLTAEMAEGKCTPEWLEKNVSLLIAFPMLADEMGILFMDSPFFAAIGSDEATSRMRRRLELVAHLRYLRNEYASEAGVRTGLMVSLLAGHPQGFVPKKARFDDWWNKCRESQAAFDTSFAAGLDSVARNDWETAEKAFGEALEAWPDRRSAAYNRALCLIRCGRPADAEILLLKLAQASPKEAIYWLRLGDACQAAGKLPDAVRAYRHAARLGGLDKDVALRLGLATAEEGNEDEAVRIIESAGTINSEMLEQLAEMLESKGIYRLSHQYRQKALEQRLAEEQAAHEDDSTDLTSAS